MATVLHIEKGRSTGATGYGKHLDRTKNVTNADPERSKYNFHVEYDKGNNKIVATRTHYGKELQERIDDRIREGYTHTNGNGQARAIRKDAVKYIDIILSASNEEMTKVTKDGKLVNWAADSFRWCALEFGTDNIVDFSVHVDETTPHIHAVVVPITKDGRLCAKEVMGNRVHFQSMQESYWTSVTKQYGIERSEAGSIAQHEDVKKYYGRVKNSLSNYDLEAIKMDVPEFQVPEIPQPPRFGRDEWAEMQNKAIAECFDAAVDSAIKKTIENAEKSTEAIISQNAKLMEENARLKKLDRSKDRTIRELQKQLDQEKQDQNQAARHHGRRL